MREHRRHAAQRRKVNHRVGLLSAIFVMAMREAFGRDGAGQSVRGGAWNTVNDVRGLVDGAAV
jgi:hypothetical protein